MPPLGQPVQPIYPERIRVLDIRSLWALRSVPQSDRSLEHFLFLLADRYRISRERLFAHFRVVTGQSSASARSVPKAHWGCVVAAAGRFGTDWHVVPPSQACFGTIPGSSASSVVFPTGTSEPSEGELPAYPYGLYVAGAEPFDAVTIIIRQAGSGLIFGPKVAVPVSVDDSGLPTAWMYCHVLQDGTGGLSASGTVRFVVDRSQWVRCRLEASWVQDGIHAGSARLYWALVLASWSASATTIRGLQLPAWGVIVRNAPEMVYINRGWDDNNDTNRDEYIDDTEWQNRMNPQATARWKYQARVGDPFNVSGMDTDFPGVYLVRVWDPVVRALMVEAAVECWSTDNGFSGLVLRDTVRAAGGSGCGVTSGGTLDDGFSSDPVTSSRFQSGLLEYGHQLIREIRAARPVGSWLMQWREPPDRPYLSGYPTVLRTQLDGDYQRSFVPEYAGLYGTVGLCRDWDYQARAAAGGYTVFHVTHRYPFVAVQGHTQSSWNRALVTSVVQFLLRYIPLRVSAEYYPHGIVATGELVTTAGQDFWRSGVPYHMAYTPRTFLEAVQSLGNPTAAPSGYEYLPLVKQSASGWSSQDIIGNTSSTQVTVNGGQVTLVPTHVFLLYPSSMNQVDDDIVIARRFSNGLVVLRTNPYTTDMNQDPSYREGNMVVQLPGSYRVVGIDGSLGSVVSSVTLKGWQGLVLRSA